MYIFIIFIVQFGIKLGILGPITLRHGGWLERPALRRQGQPVPISRDGSNRVLLKQIKNTLDL
jgi:hypothetical protein